MNSDTSLHFSSLKQALTKQTDRSRTKFHTNHPHAHRAKQKAGISGRTLREHAGRIATAGALAGALLFAPPISAQITNSTTAKYATYTAGQLQETVAEQLKAALPETVEPLTSEQETTIHEAIQNIWGINASASLQGEKLNQSYGLIGAEQHLPRYPGDSVDQHEQFLRSGITPGLGAWGHFASSRDTMTQDLVEKEKWYVAVQTLYLPDWNTRFRYLRDWYKYRKVLVVNPVNGKTLVADIADAGPSKWTGKHFGGSPEVMAYLGLNVHMQKGPVILFFVDDPNNEVPLGPVEYNVIAGRKITSHE